MPLPALLVSVRNLADARAAIEGGCDRLDVKEPGRGPLGMADLAVIAQIAAYSKDRPVPLPCSVALGEIHESQATEAPLVLPAGVSDIKLGPAGLDTPRSWIDGWRHALRRCNCERRGSIRRVAVAYADATAAGTLPVETILEMAVEVGADGFLIDTQQKNSATLLSHLSPRELQRVAGLARRAKLPFALAGSLKLENLPELVEVCPDVIAVRGAACAGGLRSGEISATCVRRLKASIAELFAAAR